MGIILLVFIIIFIYRHVRFNGFCTLRTAKYLFKTINPSMINIMITEDRVSFTVYTAMWVTQYTHRVPKYSGFPDH